MYSNVQMKSAAAAAAAFTSSSHTPTSKFKSN